MLGPFGESCWDQFGVFVCFMRDIVGIQLGSFLHSSGIVFASCWDPLGIMFGFMWSSGWGSFMVVYTFKMCFCGRLYSCNRLCIYIDIYIYIVVCIVSVHERRRAVLRLVCVRDASPSG